MDKLNDKIQFKDDLLWGIWDSVTPTGQVVNSRKIKRVQESEKATVTKKIGNWELDEQ